MKKIKIALLVMTSLLLFACGSDEEKTLSVPPPIEKDIESQFLQTEVEFSKIPSDNGNLSALTIKNTTSYDFYLIDADFSEKKAPSKKIYQKQENLFQKNMGDNFSLEKFQSFRDEKPLAARAQRVKILKSGEEATLLINLDHYIGKKAPLTGNDEALSGEMMPYLKLNCISVLIKNRKSQYQWINMSFQNGILSDKTILPDTRTKLMTYSDEWPFKDYKIPVFQGKHLYGFVDIKTGDTTLVIYNTTVFEFEKYQNTCLAADGKDHLKAELVDGRIVIADRTNSRLFIIFYNTGNNTVTIENHHA